jgi:ABC-2 type transport system ATP-binding protein
MKSSAIVVGHLKVVKSKHEILRDITLEIPSGKVVGLIGPSGSGKTTFMRALVGLQAYRGTLIVAGSSAGSKNLRSLVGYVSQSPAIYDDLSVVQNLRYFAKLLRTNNSRVSELTKLVDLEKQSHQLVGSLSGGQRARVSLAIALLNNPDILVLDEPTVGLDPILREKLWRLFKALAKQGKTLLISSHVMDEAARCDDLILLRDGNLLWKGSVSAVLKKTRSTTVEDAFIRLSTGKNA